jgi:metal-sulfur cluster biosynthetic enzyme
MLSQKDIEDKLREVIDPEIGINIVDMGLIYSIDLQPPGDGEQKINIKMTFTTPACPLINTMLSQVEAKLNEFEDADITVDVVFEPPWTPDRMSKKARMKLGVE